MKFLLAILIIIAFHFSVLGQAKVRYKIQSEECKDNKCFVRVYVAPENYDEANMQKLAQELAEKYKDKEIVNLRVFDDEKIIKAYIEGAKKPFNILSDSRAYFIHKADCIDMLFYKSEKNKVKLIKLRWKNEEKCNESFIVF